jgi:hypothetical protein
MMSMIQGEPMWHREVMGTDAERILLDLKRLGVLDRCYLAGGTGLALQFGHRRSHDLDFFCPNSVDPEALVKTMKGLSNFSLVSVAPDTLHATVGGVKISFLAYPYPVLFPFSSFQGVNVADSRDIACMKISAIASRGTKRDFVDLYVMAKQGGLASLLGWFGKKYAEVNLSLPHVLKSLIWFEDADKEPMPDMLIPLAWDEVKRYFRSESPRLLR